MTVTLTLCRRADRSQLPPLALQFPHPELCPRPSHRTAAADCAECFWEQPDHQWAEPTQIQLQMEQALAGEAQPGEAAPHLACTCPSCKDGDKNGRGNWPGSQPACALFPKPSLEHKRGWAAVPATLASSPSCALRPDPMSSLSHPVLPHLCTPISLLVLYPTFQPNSQVWPEQGKKKHVCHIPRLRQDFP